MILSKWTEMQPIIYNPAIYLIKEIRAGGKGGDSVENSMPEWSGMIGGWSIDRNIFSSVPLDGTDASDRRKTQRLLRNINSPAFLELPWLRHDREWILRCNGSPAVFITEKGMAGKTSNAHVMDFHLISMHLSNVEILQDWTGYFS